MKNKTFNKDKGSYTQIQNHDGDINLPAPVPKRSRGRFIFSLAWKTVIFCFAVWGLISSVRDIIARLPKHPKVVCHCGSSIAEAKSLGCKYDSLSTSWLPPICRDDELTAEFDRSGTGPDGEWLYYTEDNINSTTLTLDELAMRAEMKTSDERIFWVSADWHMAHCFFYWRKIERSRKRGTTIENFQFSDRGGHADHCTEMYLKRFPAGEVGVSAFTGFGDPLDT